MLKHTITFAQYTVRDTVHAESSVQAADFLVDESAVIGLSCALGNSLFEPSTPAQASSSTTPVSYTHLTLPTTPYV